VWRGVSAGEQRGSLRPRRFARLPDQDRSSRAFEVAPSDGDAERLAGMFNHVRTRWCCAAKGQAKGAKVEQESRATRPDLQRGPFGPVGVDVRLRHDPSRVEASPVGFHAVPWTHESGEFPGAPARAGRSPAAAAQPRSNRDTHAMGRCTGMATVSPASARFPWRFVPVAAKAGRPWRRTGRDREMPAR
jgi:hypothetical protein